MKELSEIVDNEINEKEKFTIDTFGKADWAINKMAVAESNIQKVTRRYKEYLDKLKQWYDDELKPHQETLNNLGEMIKPYCLQTVLANKKSKSVNFLQGSVKFRTSESVLIEDDEKVITWLEDNNPEKVIIKKAFHKKDIKEMINNNIKIPGCSILAKENCTVEITPIGALLK